MDDPIDGRGSDHEGFEIRPWKVELARKLRKEGARNRWIADRLRMGDVSRVSALVHGRDTPSERIPVSEMMKSHNTCADTFLPFAELELDDGRVLVLEGDPGPAEEWPVFSAN